MSRWRWIWPGVIAATFNAASASADTSCTDGSPDFPDPVDHVVPMELAASVFDVAGSRSEETGMAVSTWLGRNLHWHERFATYYVVMLNGWLDWMDKPMHVRVGFCDGSRALFRYSGLHFGESPFLGLSYLEGSGETPTGRTIPDTAGEAHALLEGPFDDAETAQRVAEYLEGLHYRSADPRTCEAHPAGAEYRVDCRPPADKTVEKGGRS